MDVTAQSVNEKSNNVAVQACDVSHVIPYMGRKHQ